MTLRPSLYPHRAYRSVLIDFRTQLFLKFFWLAVALIALVADVALFQTPRPILLIVTMMSFGVLLGGIWSLYQTHSHVARYLFVILLHIILITLVQWQVTTWMPYMIVPIMLMSALLMSNSMWLGVIIFNLYIALTGDVTTSPSPTSILFVTLVSGIVIHMIVSTFNVALSWYSSMHERADKLLKESRDRRAELLSTVKSLEIAYQNQRRLQQQLVYARQQAENARRMKERFASSISHELRTPLNIILGFSEIMHLTPEVYTKAIFTP
ncbi:MAG: histidine kinase dimerization/phospho-acceptor domain-containing protein, partial [Chloroflexota bacterium]